MIVSISEMVINSNKRVRIKDCIEVVDKITIGSIKSGAELSYSPETYEVTDSKGIVLKRFITKEEVITIQQSQGQFYLVYYNKE